VSRIESTTTVVKETDSSGEETVSENEGEKSSMTVSSNNKVSPSSEKNDVVETTMTILTQEPSTQVSQVSMIQETTQSSNLKQISVVGNLNYCRRFITIQNWRNDLMLRIDKFKNFLMTGGRYIVFILTNPISLASELRFLDKMKSSLMSDRWLIYSDDIHANNIIRCETAFSYFGTKIMGLYWNMKRCCWHIFNFSCGSL